MRAVLSLRTWLVLSHVAVLVLPVLILVLTGALAKDLESQTREDIQHQGALLGLLVRSELERARALDGDATLSDLSERLTPALVEAREATLAGVRLVDARGVVVASSGDELGEDLFDRPEVQQALEGSPALSVRPRPPPTRQPLASPSRRAEVRLFLGQPVRVGDEVVGAVVLSRTPREEIQALYHLIPAWVALLALGTTMLISLFAGFRFSRSIRILEATTRRLATGDVDERGELELPARSHLAEVRGLTAAFRSMMTRLRDRLRYISEFAGNVSHEFRTPITTLRGTVELLRDDEEMPPEQRARFLDNALHDLERMDRLVSGLLTLARAEEGAERHRVDLDALVARVAADHGVITCEGTAGDTLADPTQLEAVIGNLVANALQHGGEGVTVRLRPWHEGNRCGVDVEDDGRGIREANLPRVFERFFTTDRDGGGTGLGLALARAVCETHGGTVSVQSRPGATRFRVDLPRAR